MSDLYEADIARWADEQAAELRRRAGGNDTSIDWLNVAEEIEAMGRSDKREIRNRLAVICEHLLKWRFQADARSGSWRGSIVEARDQIADVIEESPSLRPYPAARLVWAYARGRRKAEADTGLLDLPPVCPWTVDQVCDPEFWPEEAA
jgi:hypothetical protein